MANGVNVKMGVSGVAQFKQSINQAKTSIKTLDAQLALTEKQYKATGDAETYMQQKTEQLQEKMAAQKQVVENAEKALADMTKRGVDMSSKAFQDMIQTLAKAKTDLLDTEMQMQGVETASDNAAAAVSEMSSDLSNIGSQVSFKTVTDGLDRITDGLKNAAHKAFQMGEQLIRATLGAGSWADELATTAAVYKGIDPTMTPEKLQQMRKTADLIDTSVESIINSKQKLSTAMGKKDIDQIFAEFGIQNTRYGELEDLDDLFWKTGEALMKVDNEAKRAQMGKKIFGDWTALIPLFEAGREEYEKTMKAQSVVSQEAIDNLTKMDDQYQKLQHEIETLKMEFLGGLSPATTKVMESLTGMVGKFNEYLQTEKGQEFMTSLADNIEKLFSSVTNFDPEDAVKKVGDVMGAITNGFKWISDNWQSVETGLKAIAGGWVLIKVATWGLKIAELVAGFKGLVGAGAGAGASAGAGAASSAAASGAASGIGSTISAITGSGVVAPAVVMGAAGYAGYKMIEANMNDPMTNYIYGDENGLNILDRMSQEQLRLAKEYEKVWEDTGSEAAMNAREALYKSFEESGVELPEHAVSLIENIFDEKMRGVDMDGLAEKFDELTKDLEDQTETMGENTAIGLANGISAKSDEAIKAAEAMATAVEDIMARMLLIRSPSRVMEQIGEYVSEGFAEGIESGYDRVNEAVDGMARVASSVSGSRGSGAASGKMIDVTLMIGPDKLTEVIVPLVDNSMGAEIDLMRR